jgi:hypothetical protein
MPTFDKFTRDLAKWEAEADKAVARQVYSYDRRCKDPMWDADSSRPSTNSE